MADTSNSTETKTVNQQITDAITQTNLMTTGLAPANSLGTLYQTVAQSAGTAIQNAVSNQQHVNSMGLAALSQNIQLILQNAQQKPAIHTTQPIIVQSAPAHEKQSANNDS